MLPKIQVPIHIQLPPEIHQVLQLMFAAYDRIMIEAEFHRGLAGSRVFRVKPLRDPLPTPLPSVVKIGHVGAIRKEWQAYKTWVDKILPGAARLEAEPTILPGNLWAGINYSLVGESIFTVQHLSDYCRANNSANIIDLFTNRLFPMMGQQWWFDSVSDSGFSMEADYDEVLPVNLCIKRLTQPPKDRSKIIDIEVDQAARLAVDLGDIVRIGGFQVDKVDLPRRSLTLTLPLDNDVTWENPFRIRVSDVPQIERYKLNDSIDGLIGEVWQTRHSLLTNEALKALDKTIDLQQERLAWPLENATLFNLQENYLLNPLLKYQEILHIPQRVNISVIHGDLNLDNILIDPDRQILRVIDFATTRRGHVLHDLIRLELEILSKLFPDALRSADLPPETICECYLYLNQRSFNARPASDVQLPYPMLEKPISLITTIRQEAQNCLYDGHRAHEYYYGLILYLVGALAYRSLDIDTTIKPILFWAAATLTHLHFKAAFSKDGIMPLIHTNLPMPAVLPSNKEAPIRQHPMASSDTTRLSDHLSPNSNPESNHNLPIITTTFVGRETEITALSDSLANPNKRLITIIGPGGIGKTRLALATAQACLPLFSDGVYYISLSSLQSEKSIIPAIAKLANLDCTQESDLEGVLIHFLSQKQVLLVMDNFDHFLDGSLIVTKLLQTIPNLRILATSRSSLKIQEEQLFPLNALSLPDQHHPVSLKDQAKYDAITLFSRSAQQINPDFALTDDNLSDVIRICRLVYGLPLGIILAAGWINVLTPVEIVEQMSRTLDFLETDLRDVPARHRNLQAVFESSWKLLTPKEQIALLGLSVFRDGFTRQAAQAVARCSLPLLKSLSDKSFLWRTPAGRFGMHELLRQYAYQWLKNSGLHVEIHNRHCRYFTSFLAESHDQSDSALKNNPISVIDEELSNVRAAWYWAIAHARFNDINDVSLILGQFYRVRGRLEEGNTLLESAITAIQKHSQSGEKAAGQVSLVLAKLLLEQVKTLRLQDKYADIINVSQVIIKLGLENQASEFEVDGYQQWGMALFKQGQYEAARAHTETALIRARDNHLTLLEANAFRLLGLIVTEQGNSSQAVEYYQQAILIYSQLDDQSGLGSTYNNLGTLCHVMGDYTLAQEHWEQAILYFQEVGDPISENRVWTNLGTLYMDLGDYIEAQVHYRQALAVCRKFGLFLGECVILLNFGLTYYYQAEYKKAEQLIRDALQIARTIGSQRFETLALKDLGQVLADQQRYKEAIALYQKAVLAKDEALKTMIRIEVQVGLAYIALEQQDNLRALRLINNALIRLEQMDSVDGFENPVALYLTCYRVLKTNQDPRSDEVLLTTHELLMKRASTIDCSERRQAFLENVTVNRQVLTEIGLMT